ncbi:MAG TPA: hypothetical protein VGY53_11685 [Isosphaeraceae bacterium]|nr:hypothetical protein [Isosphaeraceae bacterium]
MCAGAEPRWVLQLTWAFVGIGIFLRLARYALNFPFWCDESFLAANLINHSYRELLGPLDFLQVCPVLFLWIEHSIIKLLGFSELSLRLFPLLCGVASVPLFYYAASRVVRGVHLLLAVGIFAVSVHPIRLAAEVKPYASDLVVALGMLALALDWLRARARTSRLWGLAIVAPLAMALSFPAIFVAGGITAGLALPVWKTRSWRAALPFLIFNLAAAGTFAIVFFASVGAHNTPLLLYMRDYWAAWFPPLGDPLELVRWLVAAHTGKMFAYPREEPVLCGLTFLLFTVAVVALWRSRQRAVLLTILVPFLLALFAAALKRYPYGGEARLMQFVAPSICIMAGLGAATLLQLMPRPEARLRAVRVLALLAIATAVIMVKHDIARPYRFIHDLRAREFAESFWPRQARVAELACLRWDVGITGHAGANAWAPYLCYQRIHSPQRWASAPRQSAVSVSRPLRYMVYAPGSGGEPELAAWLAVMTSRFGLRRQEQIDINMGRADTKRNTVRLLIYEFTPKGNWDPSIELRSDVPIWVSLARANLPR